MKHTYTITAEHITAGSGIDYSTPIDTITSEAPITAADYIANTAPADYPVTDRTYWNIVVTATDAEGAYIYTDSAFIG